MKKSDSEAVVEGIFPLVLRERGCGRRTGVEESELILGLEELAFEAWFRYGLLELCESWGVR